MNRKWLAICTFCILVLGFGILYAQSPKAVQQPMLVDDAAQMEWSAAEPIDVFTPSINLDAMQGLALPLSAGGDVFFLSSSDPVEMAFAEPSEFDMALPFPLPDPQGVPIASGVSFQGPDPQGNITFMGFQAGLGNRVVTGAPYSATITSESVQTLADGNTIQRKTTSTVYRDSQGRTRREQTLPAIGQFSTNNAPRAIFITDPVSGVNYILDPVKKTARKMPGGPGRGGFAGPGRGPGGNPPQGNARTRQNQNVTTETITDINNIEGVLVQGTRVTRTIPAGTIGNQNAIQVTSERWHSPDLQVDLLVKNNNPAGSQNTTTFSNIRRDEPDPSLFQIPSDFTVQQPPNRPNLRARRGGPPPPPPQQ